MQEKFATARVYAHNSPMPRPRKKIHKEPINMTFTRGFKEEAAAFAGEQGASLSELAEKLLRAEISKGGGALLPKNYEVKTAPEGEVLQLSRNKRRNSSGA